MIHSHAHGHNNPKAWAASCFLPTLCLTTNHVGRLRFAHMLQELHGPVITATAANCAHLNHLLVVIKPLGALLIFVSGDMPASMPVDKRVVQLVTYTRTRLYR